MGCGSSNNNENISEKRNPAVDLSKFTEEQLANMSDEQIAAIELGNTAFMQALKHVDTTRDYSIIVDASGSMAGSLWRQAGEALQLLAPEAVKCDPDGITLYFFSDSFKKYDNVKSANRCKELFDDKSNQIFSTTDLAKVVEDAIEPDNAGRPETLLVITDGVPNNQDAVEQIIIKATKKMKKNEELSITIVQIGNDRAASSWLQHLDDGLTKKGAKFDIVDVVPFSKINSMSFAKIVELSIHD